jgi:hypothetical protein
MRWGLEAIGMGSAMRHGAVLVAALGLLLGCHAERRQARPAPRAVPTPTVEAAIAERLAVYGPLARQRLRPYFAAAGVPYPPARFLLLGLKQERELQLYAAGRGQRLRYIRAFPVLGASGGLGPKLREGDRQVPEGIYDIVYLNPRSVAHLSLALSYPNEFDRARAAEDGRDPATLGGDIMIHGGWKSVGCLAVGDQAAEDLFILAADAGFDSAKVIISPVDFRRAALPFGYRAPTPWVSQLYAQLRTEMFSLPAPTPARATSVAAGAH